ncbi:MAG: glutamate ABC transporter substrate-binding protein [Nocardia sp.]|nr:glutamate ABC transporter substrate-binding protein [Nocardia sp.]
MRDNAKHVRRSVFGAFGVALLCAAGCGSTPAPPPGADTVRYTDAATPANSTVLPSSPATPAPDDRSCGDPTASLRPDGSGRGPNLDAIRARKRLLVGLDPGSNLFSFRDPISGNLAGFDVDIAREIARDLLGSPDAVEFRFLTSAERKQAMERTIEPSKAVDIVVNSWSITCERRQYADFSTIYLMSHQRVLAMKDSGIGSLADLAGKRVCTVGSTTSLDRIRRNQPAATVITVPTWADCLVSLQQRQVEAVSTDAALLAGLAQQDPSYTQVVGPNLSDEPYGVGTPKGNDDMVRFVNATLQRIRSDGTWVRLYQQWLAPALGAAAGPPAPTYRD